MRLTLRTLLAYRDGVLDPKDASVLEGKIADSSTAQRISKRISDEMQNRRLAPIPVDAREFGFEANLVAEFLDDTIPMETLPEMERKCLENNTLLSEIGSCHQILSRALSIPAPVSSSLRERIHNLPSQPLASSSVESNGRNRRFDAPNGVASTTRSTTSVESSAKTVRKPIVELRGSGIELNDGLGRQVPEYLIGSDRSWLKTAAIAFSLLVAMVVVGAMAIGPPGRVIALLRKSGFATNSDVPEITSIKVQTSGPSIPSNKASKEVGSLDANDVKETISESSVGPPPPSPRDAAKSPETMPIDLPMNGAKDNSGPISTAPPQALKNRIQWLPDTKASSESLVLKRGIADIDSNASWTRMSPGEYVNKGDRILVPPTQRTEFRVEPGIRLLCSGETDFEQPTSKLAPQVILRSGRVILFATPDSREITLDCNGLEVQIEFAAADGSCALELQNLWGVCTEEMAQAGKIETRASAKLIGIDGTLKYSSKHASRTEEKGSLAIGQYVEWMNGSALAKQELSEAPWWFRTSISRAIDQFAATDLNRAITDRTPGELETKLFDLTTHKLGETAALAARTRIMLGRYEGLFEPEGIFNRKNLHSHWQSVLMQIPQSLGREENRVALVQSIRNAAPNRLSSILSLLVSASPQQLTAGADKLLVEALSSPQLDERVLAINQLSHITGKTLGYHPDKYQVESSIQPWRKLLGKNEIRYAEIANTETEVDK